MCSTTCRQNGNCTRYIVSSDPKANMCDQVFDAERFVYIPNARINQQTLNAFIANNDVRDFVNSIDPLCLDSFTRAFCFHFYLPCGNSTFRHVPQFLCPDTCRYLGDDLCRKDFRKALSTFASTSLPQFRGFAYPDCDNPGAIISFLNLSADCCSNGGVTIPSNVTVALTTFTTNIITTSISSSLSQTQMPITSHDIDVVGASVGSTVAVLIVLACIFISLVVFFLYLRKRKVINVQDAEKYEARYTKDGFTNTMKEPSAGVHKDCVLPVQSMHTHIGKLSDVLIPNARIQLIEILGQGMHFDKSSL